MILLIIIALILIGLGSKLVTHFYERGKNKTEDKMTEEKENLVFHLDKLTYWLLYVAAISLGSLFFGSYILTRSANWEWADLSEKGGLGDAIGGLTSPFIGFAGVIITGLAFYMQYRANRLQVDIFKKESLQAKVQFNEQLDKQNKENKISQFESQFYERLRLLKEEISELRLVNFEKLEFQGRQVFYELEKEIKFIYLTVSLCIPYHASNNRFDISYKIFYEGRKMFFKDKERLLKEFPFLNNKEFKKLENTFFNLYKLFSDKSERIKILVIKPEVFPPVSNEKKELYRTFEDFISNYKVSEVNIELMRKVLQSQDTHYIIRDLYKTSKSSQAFYLAYVDKYGTTLKHLPFHGMYTKLSIVFRQMHGLVKFVVSNDMLTYEDKRNYLRVLRGILGNYEQLHLFYNWYGGIGPQWENDENCYFSDYRMIHNLPIGLLIEDIPIENLFKDDFMYEKDKKDIDSLFEINEVFSIKED